MERGVGIEIILIPAAIILTLISTNPNKWEYIFMAPFLPECSRFKYLNVIVACHILAAERVDG